MVALGVQLLFKRIELDNLASVVAPAVLAVNTLQLSQARRPRAFQIVLSAHVML